MTHGILKGASFDYKIVANVASRSIGRPWRIVRIKSVTQEMIDRQMETARRCADLQLGVDVRLRLRGQGDIYVRQHDRTSW